MKPTLTGDELLEKIRGVCHRYQVDPQIVLAAVPHSNDPLTLHPHAALPASVRLQGDVYAKEWVNSPAGINHAVTEVRRAFRGKSMGDAARAVALRFSVG